MTEVPKYRMKSLSLPQRFIVPILLHRITEWLGTSGHHIVQPPAKAASPRTGVQAGFEYLQSRISQLENLIPI